MKWREKKSETNSSLLARVFSGSWFSKLKQKPSGGRRNEGDSFMSKHTGEVGYGYPTRYYSLEEADLDWMVPVVDKRVQGRRSTGGINPLWCESGYKFRSLGFEEPEIHRRDEFLSFSDMVLDVKKRQSEKKKRAVSENVSCSRNLSDRSSFILSPVEEDDHVFYQRESIPRPTSHMRNFDFQDKSIREMKVKTRTESSSKKKSAKSKQKTNSPRAERRNRASNDEMRKPRMRSDEDEEETVFDSFAMVKSSSNPHNDFRDSMIEMIRERGIRHPKELEQLLSCYLTLNSDEYHDLIVQVFRQVWSEMNPAQYAH